LAQERLQKILARAGVASRRAAEELIRKGRVRVNGRRVTELGTRADPHSDRVEVDGRRVVSEKPVYYLLNKPRETVTTLDDPEGRRTTAHVMKGVRKRVFPVGRLDYNTSGALLVTNDGLLAQSLLHPRKAVPKTYVVKIQGTLEIDDLNRLRNGIDIGGAQTTASAELAVLRQERGNTWLKITLTEGKNRQIHRMVEAVGFRVLRLSRLSFAGLTIEGLRPGAYRPLTALELTKLKRDYAAPPATRKSAGQQNAAQVARKSAGQQNAAQVARKSAARRDTAQNARKSAARRDTAQNARKSAARRDTARAEIGTHPEHPAPPPTLAARQIRRKQAAPKGRKVKRKRAAFPGKKRGSASGQAK
jgi:23S rRNA pseudouridine2605 synthase